MNGYVAFLISCLICGVVAAWIAKLKGRDPLTWFLIGVVINIVAVGIILGCKKAMQKTGAYHG